MPGWRYNDLQPPHGLTGRLSFLPQTPSPSSQPRHSFHPSSPGPSPAFARVHAPEVTQPSRLLATRRVPAPPRCLWPSWRRARGGRRCCASPGCGGELLLCLRANEGQNLESCRVAQCIGIINITLMWRLPFT